MERLEKLETAVRAALKLRKALVDGGAHLKMLSVPRAAVVEFDKVIAELKERQNG